MNTALCQLISIFEPKNIDWMGYKVTKKNPYTFHHIVERRYGGKLTIDNGAILSREAHDHLNYLEVYVPEAYVDWQCFFRYLNAKKQPLTKEDYEMIKTITYYETKYEPREKPRKIGIQKKKKKVK